MDCRADDGIDEKFAQAWRANQPMLLRRARRLTGGHLDRADELLAATALKALQYTRHRPHFIERPKGFLFVVLRHVFVDGVRRTAREGQVFDGSVDVHNEPVGTDDAFAPSAMQKLEVHQQIACIEAALRAMSPAQRRLFAFRFIDDLPYPQIAERMGINQPLLRKRVQLIRDRLRVEIGRAATPRDEVGVAVFTTAHAHRCEKGSGSRRHVPSPSTEGKDHG